MESLIEAFAKFGGGLALIIIAVWMFCYMLYQDPGKAAKTTFRLLEKALTATYWCLEKIARCLGCFIKKAWSILAFVGNCLFGTLKNKKPSRADKEPA